MKYTVKLAHDLWLGDTSVGYTTDLNDATVFDSIDEAMIARDKFRDITRIFPQEPCQQAVSNALIEVAKLVKAGAFGADDNINKTKLLNTLMSEVERTV